MKEIQKEIGGGVVGEIALPRVFETKHPGTGLAGLDDKRGGALRALEMNFADPGPTCGFGGFLSQCHLQ